MLYDPQAELKFCIFLGLCIFNRRETIGSPWHMHLDPCWKERRYGQIGKEALAITWACEKINDYLLGQMFQIVMDHKPLVPLLNSKYWTVAPTHTSVISIATGKV